MWSVDRGKEASLNFRAAGPDAMCLRSSRAFEPPLSFPLLPPFLFLSFHLSLIYPSFTSSPYIRSFLLRSFVGRFSLHRFFLLHV